MMDAYPPDLIAHNLPFIFLSGLGSVDLEQREYPLLKENGINISLGLSNVSGSVADELLGCFQEFDARDASWNGRPGQGKMGTIGFKFRRVGREFTLPPHKANAPSSSPSLLAPDQNPSPTSSQHPILHSPLSPLTPGARSFPDGFIPPAWAMKHQYLLPSAIIFFVNFTSDTNTSTLHDNKLKNEIDALRKSISSSSYKTRLVVVLVSDGPISRLDLDDRIANIRKATGLGSKYSLFSLPVDVSVVEIRAFVATVLSTIHPTCIEYYRDLSKHTRRKRNRGSTPLPTAPPTSGTSQTLSSQGWIVRYEFKLGFFAEFRQEMDTAGRSYESAYEALFGDDVFESVAYWSPRFDEARLLADVLIIRTLRCLLWSGQTTSASQLWASHRTRVQDIVDRKGKGCNNYGWEAWEAGWSTVMADILEKIDLPVFSISKELGSTAVQSATSPTIYAAPEKSIPIGERLPPWDLLHHPGYWLRRSAKKTNARRRLAMEIPEEDRNPPGESPASQVASKSHLYDIYLCPEPHFENPLPGRDGFEHAAHLAKTLKRSAYHFGQRMQARTFEGLQLELARECMKDRKWEDAQKVLIPLWQELSWRRAGWWKMVEEVSWTLRECAQHTGDLKTLIAVEWELMSDILTPKQDWKYDFCACLDNVGSIDSRPHTIIQSEHSLGCLSAYFAFDLAQGHVGETLTAQLIVSSRAHKSSASITVSSISIVFEGSLKEINVDHDESEQPAALIPNGSVQMHDVTLHEDSSPLSSPSSKKTNSMTGLSNLTIPSASTKVFEFSIVPRIAGEIKATNVILHFREDLFDLDVVISLNTISRSDNSWFKSKAGLSRKTLTSDLSFATEILPKPPKLQIDFSNIQVTYYTDEIVVMKMKIVNAEDEEAEAILDVKMTGQSNSTPQLYRLSDLESPGETPNDVASADSSHFGGLHLGKLAPSTSREESISFCALHEMAEYELEVKVTYHLPSDPDTSISKATSRSLVFIRPFEANCDFLPRIHPDPWPNYFNVGETEGDEIDASTEEIVARGLVQRWSLLTRTTSLAVESLVIESMELRVVEIRNGATCKIFPNRTIDSRGLVIAPKDLCAREFGMELQKFSLEDRRSSTMALQMEIQWRRDSPGARSTITSLAVPQVSVPFGEPRVLASAEPSPEVPSLIHLDYVLENPSIHVLNFNLTMEGNEDFAFSGPRSLAVQLVPLSRHTVRYNVLSSVKGGWIQPVLRVVDTYFNKTLRISETEGMRADKRGILVWVDADG